MCVCVCVCFTLNPSESFEFQKKSNNIIINNTDNDLNFKKDEKKAVETEIETIPRD